ncbi:uncharacterized protein LOC126746298 [Anthonomus grandis grandis]|uniref:uncharacterized protein LOC126746298 n=1 Tax=Anthonomus grandis grandis TaxID=2921223 RepID=UPI002165E5D1|nr:uncharacterized protein LOC126746298 [Anthonomus grandis grandis]
MVFSSSEQRDMVQIYYSLNRNSQRSCQQYLEQYPERPQPNYTYFGALDRNLSLYGSFTKPRNMYGTRVHPETEQAIINAVTQNPQGSTRQFSRELNMPSTRIHRVLRKNRYRPYKLHISQELKHGDTDRRLQFCNWLNEKLQDDEDFLNKIIWTDECNFSTNGLFNRNNEHFYSVENPRQNREVRRQGHNSFNVWVGLYRNRILGPIIYDGNLTAECYLDLILPNIFDVLENEPLDIIRDLWWQQDGAPPHNGRNVTRFLNHNFPNQWIGNQGLVRWQARSPDLSPLDYFLWGYLKNRLFKNTPNDINILRANLLTELRGIRARTIQRAVSGNLRRRIQKCIEVQGQLFEYLL